MGHRDLLVTHTLSEAEYHGCRPHPRRSVRRASGFVLTGYSGPNERKNRDIITSNPQMRMNVDQYRGTRTLQVPRLSLLFYCFLRRLCSAIVRVAPRFLAHYRVLFFGEVSISNSL